MNIAIKVEHLSKIYQIGKIGTGTISQDMERWIITKVLRKADPFLKIGESNNRSEKGSSNVVYSLRDINFEIQQGDAVGIIGKNGAGKSTLLKLLSRVTSPTTGSIKINGRIASLLEVGTGFHPELSGRENIYLNGAILGMRKKEITRKLDEIIDFSGVERYIDTPVKRYSSGMYVRLAFAVAAHLESEILIVDEVLAVGDAEFQKKCLGKMGEVSKGEGRTVLFVSHNMAAVQKLCSSAILLQNGTFCTQGKTNDVVAQYLNQSRNGNSEYVFNNIKPQNKIAYTSKLSIEDSEGNLIKTIPIGKTWKARVGFTVTQSISGLIVGLGIADAFGVAIQTSWSAPQDLEPGNYESIFTQDCISLNTGKYNLRIGISKGFHIIDYLDEDTILEISEDVFNQEDSVLSNSEGIINNQMKVQIFKNQ